MKAFAVILVAAGAAGFVLEREYRKYLTDRATR